MEHRLFLDPVWLREIGPREGDPDTSEVRLSPFDVPEEVIATNEADGTVRVQFVYDDEERLDSESLQGLGHLWPALPPVGPIPLRTCHR